MGQGSATPNAIDWHIPGEITTRTTFEDGHYLHETFCIALMPY